METLQSIFKTSGQEFIDNLMNCSVTVYEKVNTSIFSVSKINDNEFVYYKGNGKKDGHKINLVDEISSTFYKRGIEHIENCSQIKKDKIPKGWTFVFFYFPTKKTSFIEYNSIPKSGLSLKLIITDNGTYCDDIETLKPWAEDLNVGYEKPIFNGFLNNYQKEEITKYISGEIKNVTCFSKFIICVGFIF